MMRAMGRAVDRLAGRYLTAEDVGSTVADMDEVARETAHVAGHSDGDGDPSPFTAHGVFLCLRAAVRHRLGRELAGVHVAVKGLGSVGFALAAALHAAGARLTVADIDPARIARAREAFGAAVAPVDAIAAPAGGRLRALRARGRPLGGQHPRAPRRHRLRRRQQPARDPRGRPPARPRRRALLPRLPGERRRPDLGGARAARPRLGRRGGQARRAARSTLTEILARAEREGRGPGAVADGIARARFRPAADADRLRA